VEPPALQTEFRVHPAGFAALFLAALDNEVDSLTVSSCWRPTLSSVAHRAGLGLDVDYVGKTCMNREELRAAFEGKAPCRKGNANEMDNVSDREVKAFGEYEEGFADRGRAIAEQRRAEEALTAARKSKDPEGIEAASQALKGAPEHYCGRAQNPMTRQVSEGFLRRNALAALLMLSCQAALAGPSAGGTAGVALPQWIDRPWEFRYFLQVTTAWDVEKRIVEKARRSGQVKRDRLQLAGAFNPAATLKIADAEDDYDEPISVVAIEFDRSGAVTTPHTHGNRLRGGITRLQYLLLSDGEDLENAAQYPLAKWFTGLGDVSTHWAPAFCTHDQAPNALLVRHDIYLYGKLFKVDEHATTFGCREWAYQLYDDQRPYIDVTSYVPKGKTFEHGTYIRDFIGWARFGDKKPVIGKHRTTWYCLHDCPDQTQPGPIADIKEWASKRGWSVPKPPTRVPTFPDPPDKQGTYPR